MVDTCLTEKVFLGPCHISALTAVARSKAHLAGMMLLELGIIYCHKTKVF